MSGSSARRSRPIRSQPDCDHAKALTKRNARKEKEETMPDIVGTWCLVGAVSTDPDGRPLPTPYGPQAIGRIAFTADRRVMVAVCDGRPQLPAGTRREYGGYCGDYTFDGTTLTTNVDAAPNPALVGTSQ